MANQVHFCDHCMHHIEPGDMYRADVYATAEHIIVLRRHYNPPCPVDPMEEQAEMERMCDEIEKQEAAENEKDVAA
jgi:predicted ATP-grasp superfamily ATP-dependent carboligase